MTGIELRDYRKKIGIIQDQLANLLHVSNSTVYSWEKGLYKINEEIVKKIKKITSNDIQCFVYRYRDNKDWKFKYVGIVYDQSLKTRHKKHLSSDSWLKDMDYTLDYFEVRNRSEAEAWESHLISKYKTNEYYNISKNNWGINSYLDQFPIDWKTYYGE